MFRFKKNDPCSQIINQAALAIVVYQHGIIKYANKTFYNLLGISSKDADNKNILDFIHPNDKRQMAFALNEIENNKDNNTSSTTLTYRVSASDNQHKWFKSNLSFITWNESPAIIDIITDASRQKEIEGILLEDEKNYRQIFNALDDYIFILNGKLKIIQANFSVYNDLGYEDFDLSDKSLEDILSDNYKEQFKKYVNNFPQSLDEIIESEIITKRGKEIPVEIHLSDGYWGNKPVFFIRCINLTDKKQSEKQLNASRLKFIKAFNSNPNPMTINDQVNGIFKDINKAFEKITGYTKAEVIGKTANELNIINKEDEKRIFKLINGENNSSKTDLIINNKSGDQLNVIFYSERLLIEDSAHTLIAIVDISEIKKAEKEIKNSKARQNAILDNMPHEAWLKDRNGNYLAVNRTFADSVNKTIPSIIGKKDSDLYPINEAEKYNKEDKRVMDSQERQRLLGYKKDKKQWVETYKTPIFDHDNKLLGTAGISSDITNTINYELKLKKSLGFQQSLTDISSKLNSLDEFADKINYSLNAAATTLDLNSIKIIEKDDNGDINTAFCWTKKIVIKERCNKLDEINHNTKKWDNLFENNDPIYFDNECCKKRDPQKYADKSCGTILHPIFADNKLIAIIEINKNDDFDKELSEHVDYIKTFGNLITYSYQRNEVDKKIKKSEHRFREFAELLPEMVCETDTEGNITFANNYTYDNFGYTKDDSFTLFDLITDKEVAKDRFMELISGKQLPPKEYIAVRKDSTTFPTIMYSNLIYSSDKIIGIRLVMTNISEQKKNEQELIHAKEKAEAASLIKQQFLSTMSHEIRTPMNAVIGMSHILLEDNPKPEQIENLKTLQSSAKNLLILVNDILDFNKIETGNITLVQSKFSIRELVDELRKSFRYATEEKELEFRINVDNRITDTLIGDKPRIIQVLTNLIGNAIKFTPHGHIGLILRYVREHDNTIDIEFRVEDTGIGIRKDKINHIFKHFTQETSDTTRKYGGTGLGLAISKKLVEMHNSEIFINSTPGKGSVFFFTLNLKYIKEEEKKSNNNKDKQTFTQDEVADKKILVVEDNEINRVIVSKFLRNWNIKFDYATNGKEAVDKVSENNYNMILMDLEMPEMSGYDATKIIRDMDDPLKKSVPIIALTAAALLDVKNKIVEIGMNDYVLKPFNPKNLYKVIRKHLFTTFS
jgi:PAS domain S-box-containing protein